jgi:V/A-type H+/Na+-transporting ATPase subunit F
MEIAVIGGSEFVVGFRLAGIRKIYDAEDDEKLRKSVSMAMEDPDVGILVMYSRDMDRLPARTRSTLENSIRPTVITIGAQEGGLSMRERIKRSVGVDLWK